MKTSINNIKSTVKYSVLAVLAIFFQMVGNTAMASTGGAKSERDSLHVGSYKETTPVETGPAAFSVIGRRQSNRRADVKDYLTTPDRMVKRTGNHNQALRTANGYQQ